MNPTQFPPYASDSSKDLICNIFLLEDVVFGAYSKIKICCMLAQLSPAV